MSIPAAFVPKADQWLLTPQYRVFGSDELSSYADAIKEMIAEATLTLSPADARSLGLTTEDGVRVYSRRFYARLRGENRWPSAQRHRRFCSRAPRHAAVAVRRLSYRLEKKAGFMRAPDVIVSDGARIHG